MTLARLVALILFAFLLVVLAGTSAGVASAFITATFAAAAFVIYFSPAMIAETRGHPNTMAIFILNLSLGWTVLGWIVSLIWAHTGFEAHIAEDDQRDPDYVPCPFCAEDIRAEAILCRHCGSMLQDVETAAR